MKFNVACKPEEAMCKDSTRYSLTYANLNREEKRLEVTDGKILARIPVEVTRWDTSGPVSADALKKARKLARFGAEAEVKVNGGYKFSDGSTLPREVPEDFKFPHCAEVLPCFDAGAVTVCLNPELLLALCRAAGSPQAVKLTFRVKENGQQDGTAMKAEFHGRNQKPLEGEYIIMPLCNL